MNESSQHSNIPTVLIVLGATGDLMAKKIAPALWHLHRSGELPERFRLVGVSRRDWADAEFKRHLEGIWFEKPGDVSRAELDAFLGAVQYHKLTFHESGDYAALARTLAEIDAAWGQCSNKLFYLSVPPQFYADIFDNLHASGLSKPCDDMTGWSRIVVEKPFGRDEASAKALDEKLAKLFKEEQIYRIDHYLAKEILQNIITFRFGNNLFEGQWDRRLIERIEVRMHETLGLEDRGDSYDGVGALRDVGQNHLLSMLALITMDEPRALDAAHIRGARLKILENLEIFSEAEAAARSFRAQYGGFRDITGVAPDSKTETFFRIEGALKGERWHGVPFILESGKRLLEGASEIDIFFKHPEPCLCPAGRHAQNRLRIHAKPREGITITLFAKKPGYRMELEERSLSFDFRGEKNARQTEDYEKLLLDCIRGDQTLFLSSGEIAAMWRFVDPFLRAWEEDLASLAVYAPGTYPAMPAQSSSPKP